MDTVTEFLNVIYGLSCLCHPGKGVRYVGQTKRGAEARLAEHRRLTASRVSTPLSGWVRKHGPSNIVTTVLEVVARPEDLNEAEVRIIAAYRALGLADLNMTAGGELRVDSHSLESRAAFAKVITEADVPKILTRYLQGETYNAIAADYGVSSISIGRIVRGERWEYVAPELVAKVQSRHKKLDPDSVRRARALHEQGYSQAYIGGLLGVGRKTIGDLLSGKNWTHVA
jgi:uncharacterized protein YerC